MQIEETIVADNQIRDNDKTQGRTLRYTLTSPPPLSITITAALQHILMCLPASLAIPFIVADGICAEYDSPIRTTLFSSSLFMCGVCTLLQTALGVRLPILQGPSAVFLPVILAVQKSDSWKCVDGAYANVSTYENITTSTNVSSETVSPVLLTQEEKLQQLSGSIMAASLVEILIGGTGLIGRLLRFVGPITVAPTIALIGLSLYKIPIRYSKSSWELSLTGACLVVVFSLYLGHVKIPLPTRTNCKSRCKSNKKVTGVRLFQLLPVLMGILVVWAISGILTCTNVFPSDPGHPRFRARADAKSKLIHMTPWFYLPHPGQFGLPSFNLALYIGFMAAFFASLIESVGDYFAAAKACEVDAPPTNAVNRGILLEGIGGFLSGAVGVGNATTSYSVNIAAMTLTKTANSYVMLCAGVIMILLSVVGKFGAVLATIPDPALGGALAVIYGMLVSLGLSTLQYVNLNSPRNLLILGLAFFIGIFVPEWIDRYPEIIRTGSREADSVLKVALGTPMFLGGVIAILLDNTTRGSRTDRGIDAWQVRICATKDSRDTDATNARSTIYGCRCTSGLYKYLPCFSKLPFMPAYDQQTGCTDSGNTPMIIYRQSA